MFTDVEMCSSDPCEDNSNLGIGYCLLLLLDDDISVLVVTK